LQSSFAYLMIREGVLPSFWHFLPDTGVCSDLFLTMEMARCSFVSWECFSATLSVSWVELVR
jgi:hypothetical protein